MGNIRQGPPEAIVLHLMREHAIGTFVETGTFMGNTARWASNHFKHVFTIEFAESIYRQAVAAHAGVPQITFLFGHTREKLAEVVPQLGAPAIFWLDAHWSDGATYGAGDECPVLDEIAIIVGASADHIILIDDARMFLAPPPRPHETSAWPDIAAVTQALDARGPRYTVVLEDVIVSAPASARAALSTYFQNYVTAQLRQPQPARRGLLGRARQTYQRAIGRVRRVARSGQK